MLSNLISRTIVGFLIIAGLGTCSAGLAAYDTGLAQRLLLSGLVTVDPSVVPIFRHWGMMVFGIGALLVAAAFRPELRFAAMLFSLVEKAFMVYLFAGNLGQPWSAGYLAFAISDTSIVAYSLLYIFSSHGRPQRWRTDQLPGSV